MKKLFLLFLILALHTNAQHQIDYRISALGNLIYQLDCMTQVARFRCSTQSFQQLWQSEIEPNENDAAMLKKWGELREKINKTISLAEKKEQKQPKPTSANYPENASDKINLLEKVRILAMSSKKEDYLKNLSTLISIDYALQETQIINHFQPRFDIWFSNQKNGLKTFIKEAKELGKQAKIPELLTSLRHFYQSDLPEEMTLPVYLIAHPKANAPTSGLVFAENSLIEVLKGEKAENRLGVVVHEIAHFYHERAPKTLHNLIMNHFVTGNSATGKIGYYLFNEGIATAIGNGLLEERLKDKAYFEKYLAYPLSFYSNQGIDKAAKSALSLVKDTLENKQSIDQKFLNQLDKTWSKSLEKLKNAPKERLRHVGMVLLHEDSNELLNHIFALIAPSSAHMNTLDDISKPEELVINQFTHLDAIIIAQTWEQLNQLDLEPSQQQPEKADFSEVIHLDNGTVRIVIVSQSKDYIKKQIETILQTNFVKK